MAESIADDINTDIFILVKRHLQEVEASATANMANSDLERLGNFVIDKTPTAGNTADDGAYVEKRPDILDSIENPQPAPRSYGSNTPEIRTEPLVDHLLTTPTIVPPQQIVVTEKTVTSIPTKAAVDPYKEAIN